MFYMRCVAVVESRHQKLSSLVEKSVVARAILLQFLSLGCVSLCQNDGNLVGENDYCYYIRQYTPNHYVSRNTFSTLLQT